MKYSIVGSGKVGKTLAGLFASRDIDVLLANSRGPESLAALVADLGPHVFPVTLDAALDADMIFFAVGFLQFKDVASKRGDWGAKIVVDVTNAMRLSDEERKTELQGRLSSEVNADRVLGAKLVKAFNHLLMERLGTNPPVDGQSQAIFVSSNHADASKALAALAVQLGFAPIELGRLNEGGVPLHFLDGKPGGLILQNLIKLG